TDTRAAASDAAYRSVATTAATMSPAKRALSRVIARRVGAFMSGSVQMHGTGFMTPSRSEPVTTATTHGAAFARAPPIDRVRPRPHDASAGYASGYRRPWPTPHPPHPRKGQVVVVGARAGHEPRILAPLDRGPEEPRSPRLRCGGRHDGLLYFAYLAPANFLPP